jgi:hypothetical protein
MSAAAIGNPFVCQPANLVGWLLQYNPILCRTDLTQVIGSTLTNRLVVSIKTSNKDAFSASVTDSEVTMRSCNEYSGNPA